MPLQLDHTIVPAYDKVKSAKFIARMFGLEYTGTWGHFAPVKINDALTLDFDDSDNPQAPITTPSWLRTQEFDAVLQRIKDDGIPIRQRTTLPDRRRDQPQAHGPRVLLRVRERARMGGHHPHVHHRMRPPP